MPYFLWLAFRLRQTLHALQTLVTRGPSPMKVKCCLSVSSNLFIPGCSRCVWYHSVTLRSRDLGMTILSSQVISSYLLSECLNSCLVYRCRSLGLVRRACSCSSSCCSLAISLYERGKLMGKSPALASLANASSEKSLSDNRIRLRASATVEQAVSST